MTRPERPSGSAAYRRADTPGATERTGINRVLSFVLIFVAVFMVGCQLDIMEQWVSWTSPHEDWEADEILVALLAAFIGLALLTLHRERLYRREVREHARTSERLREALESVLNANNVKSAFLAGVSHELRTPLNAIIGFSDIIRSELLGPITPARYHEYAEDIFRSAQHLNRMVCGLLDIARVEAGDYQIVPEQIRLTELVDDIVEAAHPEAASLGIILEVHIPETAVICADRQAMVQILSNLVFNALHLRQPGGTISIHAECCTAKWISIGVHHAGGGIEPDDLAHVFDPFVQETPYQTRLAAETVLSLTVVKRLVDLHGGTIHVSSTEGVGVKIEISVPGTDTRVVTGQPETPEHSRSSDP